MASTQYKLFSGIISLLPLQLRMQVLFYRRFKRLCNFTNPKTFNEKLQIKKLEDRDALLPIAADKIKSKAFVKNIAENLYIPKTIWESGNADDIDNLDWDELPNDYVFKANHTSQTIEIIKNGNHLPKKKMKSLANKWLKHDQASSLGEWAYQNIPPKVFIEEFLDFDGKEPDDYKFFVYHGQVHFIQLDSDRFTNHTRNMFDKSWNELDFDYSCLRKNPTPAKPHFLDSMVDIAEKIGDNFDFVRVDLYWYNDMVTFGELTIYPGAGFEKFPSQEWDELFGEPWKQNYGKDL
ncbi:hypothetical protein CMT41_02250 [Colwellia sp. MT41]|uniref:ATP-grasp fold amidoligase family protein n=1 Tax=Colwellia sp. MT41 TaxID=58049 RepID=UPI000717AE34|nr:ATP-grasp fold amidoligase family protein [Colwellia sp. MT41]ALO33664.1 hypothetical protein CMT41_02250 [Colwellia sp. MT41]